MPDSWDPMDCSPPGSSGIFPGKNTGVGCHILFQGILQTQGLNLCLLGCKHTFLPSELPGKPLCNDSNKTKQNKKPHETWLRPFRLKFSLNLFPMSLSCHFTNATVPSKNCMETIPFTLHLFPLYFPFMIDLSWATCEVEKTQQNKTPVALEHFLPTELNSEGCETFRKGWCHEPSALLGQTGYPHLRWAGVPGFDSNLAPVAMFRIEHQTTYEDGIDELQKLHAQFIRTLTITCHCNVLNPPSVC